MKALWNNKVIADSKDTITIEGNAYFPPDSISKEYYHDSPTETTCIWKGKASYFNIKVDGKENPDAAFTYKDPKKTAKTIVKKDFSNYVAFWRGVEIQK